MSATITDTDRGLAQFAARLAGKVSVSVGILSEEPKEGSDGASLLEIAAIHEFGAPAAGIPQRSFIRATVDEKQAEIQQLQLVLAKQIIAGKTTGEKAVELIGARVAGMIKQRIAQGIEPPNAPSTIERKGSSKPLIDTGQLRSSVTWKVNKGER